MTFFEDAYRERDMSLLVFCVFLVLQGVFVEVHATTKAPLLGPWGRPHALAP